MTSAALMEAMQWSACLPSVSYEVGATHGILADAIFFLLHECFVTPMSQPNPDRTVHSKRPVLCNTAGV